MSAYSEAAIIAVQKSKESFCKFISANDAGKTGAHQAGYYMPKNAVELMFDSPGIRGENKEKFVKIKWQGDFETNSRFIYYGVGTRNEYRLTRFGKGFPFLSEDNVGDLLVLAYIGDDYYEGFVLQSDEETEEFLSAFNLSPTETNHLIKKNGLISSESNLNICFNQYINSVSSEFPTSAELANRARFCFNNAYQITPEKIINEPDKFILHWLESEYQLFRYFENDRYKDRIKAPFSTVEEIVIFANTILNRRKSRAGKSLEHHLEEIFHLSTLQYQSQAITEDNKRPDFLFPDSISYHAPGFNKENLICLAAKTTCKDRWRQILNEADKIKFKHLFTTQQGISSNQLREMYKYNVILIVPEPYKKSFPAEYRSRILSLDQFVNFVKSKQF